MPANVILFDSSTVESTLMAREEEERAAAAPSTCQSSSHKVNEPASEQVENGIKALELTTENSLEKEPLCPSLTFPETITISCQKRLQEQARITREVKMERDKQLRDIESHLMLMESELRKEQIQITQLLEEKDRTIAVQERQINALLVLNRKLAAKLNKHKCSLRKSNAFQSKTVNSEVPVSKTVQCISSHNSDVVLDESATPDLLDKKKTSSYLQKDQEQTDFSPKCVDTEEGLTSDQKNLQDSTSAFANDLEHHLNSLDEYLPEYDSDNEIADGFPHSKRLHTLEELDESEDAESKENEHESALLLNKFPPHSIEMDKTLHLSACYNRVMSNHRNVTKPKDVKYKKINRVKSRSLEELRGKLRNWTHPFFLSEKST